MDKEELHRKVIDTIEFIKKTYKEVGGKNNPIEVFRWGNCGNLYEFLSDEFPEEASPCGVYVYKSLWHIIAKIGEKYYDIGGEFDIESYISYLFRTNVKEYGMSISSIPMYKESYSIGPVLEEIETYIDKYDVRSINGKTVSSELPTMKKMTEILQRRRELNNGKNVVQKSCDKGWER